MRENKSYIYFLEILACLFLIINRSLYDNLDGLKMSYVWIITMVLFFITNMAIPLFLMTAGAKLLGYIEEYKDIFMRIFKAVISLLVFSFFYYALETPISEWFTRFNLITLSKTVWSHEVTVTFRYLYIYLSLLIMLPLLRKMLKNFSHMDYSYFITAVFLFSATFPIAMIKLSIPNLNELVKVPIFSSYLGYFVLGYFLDNVWTIYRRNLLRTMTLTLVFFMGLSVYLTYGEFLKTPDNYMYWQNITSFTMMIPSVCFFWIFKYIDLNKKIEKTTAKLLKKVGECCIGIFLLSDFFIKLFEPFSNNLEKYIIMPASVIITGLLVLICGFLMTVFLKKIPIIKNLF